MTRPSRPDALRPLGDANEHFWRVQRMARAAGVNPAEAAATGALGQDDWAQIITNCRGCPDPDGCARWLGALDGHSAGAAPDLCPQAATFAKLRAAATEGSENS